VRKYSTPVSTVVFASESGLPVHAHFTLTRDAANPRRTAVDLTLKHGTPTLIWEWIGKPAFKQHVKSIVTENLEARSHAHTSPSRAAARHAPCAACQPL